MPRPVPRISFSHFGLYTADLAKMEDFYTRFMGFTVTDRGALEVPGGKVDLVFLSRDPREHHQIVLASGRPADLPFNVVNQLSFRVDSLADLRALHGRLQREPVSEIRPVSHGNALSVYFRDPEGNRVELFSTRPGMTQPLRIRSTAQATSADALGQTLRANFPARPAASGARDGEDRMA
jgi:catechol 2,3-dioxygenase-like lactoylglutathione lyase family enzyme